MFSHTKSGHLAHILTSGVTGSLLTTELTPPDPATLQAYGHLIIQILVGAVTIWSMIRKALQKPEQVIQVPAAVTVPATAAGPTTITPPPPAAADAAQ